MGKGRAQHYGLLHDDIIRCVDIWHGQLNNGTMRTFSMACYRMTSYVVWTFSMASPWRHPRIVGDAEGACLVPQTLQRAFCEHVVNSFQDMTRNLLDLATVAAEVWMCGTTVWCVCWWGRAGLGFHHRTVSLLGVMAVGTGVWK